MTDELKAGILLTNDCFLCDKFTIVSKIKRGNYCKFYLQRISQELMPLWKYKNITEIHCIHYQIEKENIKNKEV
jgi:hypothetical protein